MPDLFDSTEKMRELEKQLSCPSGPLATDVAHMMNESNIGMTLQSIDALDLQPGNHVLEPGHGNGGHLRKLLAKAPDIRYTGLEISPAMTEEAKRLNASVTSHHPVTFVTYEGDTIPFPDHTFDRLMTVNTLYFWKNPISFIQEISRVVKVKGYAVVTFVEKESMERLPFVGDLFTLYSETDFGDLIDRSPMEIMSQCRCREHLTAKSGESIERFYRVMKLKHRS